MKAQFFFICCLFLFGFSRAQEQAAFVPPEVQASNEETLDRLIDLFAKGYELRLMYEGIQKKNKNMSRDAFKQFLSSSRLSKKAGVVKLEKEGISAIDAFNTASLNRYHTALSASKLDDETLVKKRQSVPRTPRPTDGESAMGILWEIAFSDELKSIAEIAYKAPVGQKMRLSEAEARRRMRNLDAKRCRQVLSLCKTAAYARFGEGTLSIVTSATLWTFITPRGPITSLISGIGVSVALIAEFYLLTNDRLKCDADYDICEIRSELK